MQNRAPPPDSTFQKKPLLSNSTLKAPSLPRKLNGHPFYNSQSLFPTTSHIYLLILSQSRSTKVLQLKSVRWNFLSWITTPAVNETCAPIFFGVLPCISQILKIHSSLTRRESLGWHSVPWKRPRPCSQVSRASRFGFLWLGYLRRRRWLGRMSRWKFDQPISERVRLVLCLSSDLG